MVDTGATHNFLSDRIVARLGLRVDKGNSKIKAVNSEAKPILRVAKIVPLQIGEWSGKFYLMLVPLHLAKLFIMYRGFVMLCTGALC